MWETWTRMGVVCDVGLISGPTMTLAVDKVIACNRQLQISSQDVANAVSPSRAFFNNYQMYAVGRLNDTTGCRSLNTVTLRVWIVRVFTQNKREKKRNRRTKKVKSPGLNRVIGQRKFGQLILGQLFLKGNQRCMNIGSFMLQHRLPVGMLQFNRMVMTMF